MGLGVVFSGQGNQYPAMFHKLNLHNPGAVANLAEKLGFSLTPEVDLSTNDLFANNYSQPLIAGYEYLLWQELAPHIPSPVVLSGYSLGEVSAFVASAGLNLDALLAMARTRARLMSGTGLVKSGLAAVSGLSQTTQLALCAKFACYIAIENGPEQYVIGGESDKLAKYIDYIHSLPQEIKITPLDVAVASHTPILTTASEGFATYLADYITCNLATKVIAGVSANIHYTAATLIPELVLQIHSTIHFNKVIQVMFEAGASVILEIGPGTALANIIKKYTLPLIVKSVDDFSSISGLITWINKVLSANKL